GGCTVSVCGGWFVLPDLQRRRGREGTFSSALILYAVTTEDLLASATEAVRWHMGVNVAPSWSNVALHRDCIPQYYIGHSQRVDSMRGFIKNKNLSLSLIGSSYDGVSVNDVIFSGQTAVTEFSLLLES
uniref:Amine oxidase domain-containing protein n=1 Tax=Fundulus heteroclitus TaxID=8078 RepID=A0A3Q2Q109_FUNHE